MKCHLSRIYPNSRWILFFFYYETFLPAVCEARSAGACTTGLPQVINCLPFVCLQLQRAVAVKRAIQDVLDRSPRLQALTPPKTREVVQWCRQRGYTPPDLEPQHKNDDESIEDILTQIDNEPGESEFRRSLAFPGNPEWIDTFLPCVGEELQLWSPVECEGGQCSASGYLQKTSFIHFYLFRKIVGLQLVINLWILLLMNQF